MCDLSLSCQCGKVKGIAKTVTKRTSIRIVCYCRDCQAFANEIGAGDRVLNEHGGTEIFQVAPARVHFTQGEEQIACLRFSETGPFRWYAGCCNTPIGNTAKPSFPFIGLNHAFIETELAAKKSELGPVRWHCQTQDAADSWPRDQKRNGFPIGLTWHVMRTILGWKIRGLSHPNPLFSEAGSPLVQPHLVGPRP
ncbi:MAG: DUF6151 family protein [Pelagimonas sp.]|uniref:DUF6151 family protein n=1 Tax=Pelagimonas sp. TaxID=2073170 RepID=UPI003D6A159F